MNQKLKVSTPGRICLFGEHQDYLNLPIIACAISKRIFIEGSKRDDKLINIDLPDINEQESFQINGLFEYKLERDYIRSSINVLLKKGFTFSNAFNCKIKGEIPINAGTSSSSALIVAWINFLARMSDQNAELKPEEIADLAYRAEVLEFGEPGGMMDHYSTAVGEIIGLSSYPEINLKKIKADLRTFVLGNSGEPKDTKSILARVKNGVLDIVKLLEKKYPGFSLQTVEFKDVEKYKKDLSDEQCNLLKGTICNRDITFTAMDMFENNSFDHSLFGELLNKQQIILRDILKISTPKIDSMIKAALDAGAIGGKINGSGGGGCMFAYAPINPEKVLNAVKLISGEAYIVNCDKGTLANYEKEN
jgi:galactokinase